MKTTDQIPTGKLRRAGKIIKTGLKVGKNYASYYGEKMVNNNVSKEKLDSKNASAIMKSLQQLKGGGLKVAQMLSMEKNLLPQAYVDQFSLAQFSVPPLSAPLVKKTFTQHFGSSPEKIFDTFDYHSTYAASIGQVHLATKDGQKLAVKIQYPGVGTSIQSDLAMLKPLASRIMNLNMQDIDHYFTEVESKLIEETDYQLEVDNSIELSKACQVLTQIKFPQYYPSYSNKKIITMEWIDGLHLSEWLQTDRATSDNRNTIAQLLWDFYMYQIHQLRKVHADPHPGNILITADDQLAIIDFGCVKELPLDFYTAYVSLLDPHITNHEDRYDKILMDLEMLYVDDSEEEKTYFKNIFSELLSFALRPFRQEVFDFSDSTFFNDLVELGDRMSKEILSSEYKPNRGSKHMIYINRTMFGLYQLLHHLQATIHTRIDLPHIETPQS